MRPLPRCLLALLSLAAAPAGLHAATPTETGQPAAQDTAAVAKLPTETSATEATAPPATAPAAGEPLYSLDAYRQNAQDLILEFAHRTGQSLSMLDQYSALVSVQFHDLPFEKALKRLTRAADLDYIKDEDDSYVVGLPIDLKLRFPAASEDPDKFIDATYRCRRIDAK